MRKIGITETYDPCFVPDWETRLLDANIIISKELNDEMIEKLLVTQDRVIFHHTVTGQGGTVLEPNVKTPEHEFEQYRKLLEIDGVELEFEPEALREIAQTALLKNTGARGLRAIMENVMENIMFDIPDEENVKKCILTKASVLGEEQPVIVRGKENRTA